MYKVSNVKPCDSIGVFEKRLDTSLKILFFILPLTHAQGTFSKSVKTT